MVLTKPFLRRSSCASSVALTILLIVSASSWSQCIQQATRTFGPYPPAQGSVKTLVNPLLRANTPPRSTLKIVTLGDSVVWGDGNTEQNKFVVKVAHDLANATDRSTEIVAYAHSGARLATADDPNSLVPTDGPVYQMDLNSERPTTAEQEQCAAAHDADAELVILDGCINEVGATKIALPIPLNWTTTKHIHQWAYAACSQPMLDLLKSVKLSFPAATIVVVNYYQIVTGLSTLELKQQLPGTPKPKPSVNGTPKSAARELQAEQDKLLALYGQEKTQLFDEPIPKSADDVLYAWQNNSIQFLSTSEDCFSWAVAAADGNAVGSIKGLSSCPTDPANVPPSPAQATEAVHVYLAKVPENDAYGYGAPRTHEWRLPSKQHPDDMYTTRVPLCNSHYQGDAGAKETCKINAMAHPNVDGAEAYHQSIWTILQTAWEQRSAH
jgi:hypothetical protein